MKLFQEIRRTARKTYVPGLILFILTYTYYQMLTGERGLMMWYNLKQQIATLEQENLALRERVDLMEEKTLRLGSREMDRDYVDEMVRRNLPLLKASERIILLPRQN